MSATATAPSSAFGKAPRGQGGGKPHVNGKGKPTGRQTLSRGTQQSEAAKARWEPKFESEAAVRDFFLHCTEGEGLEALKVMRKHAEIAAMAYDENMNAARGQFCETCGKQVGDPPYQHWWKIDKVVDPVTRAAHNVFFCSQPCWIGGTEQNGKASRAQGQPLAPSNR